MLGHYLPRGLKTELDCKPKLLCIKLFPRLEDGLPKKLPLVKLVPRPEEPTPVPTDGVLPGCSVRLSALAIATAAGLGIFENGAGPIVTGTLLLDIRSLIPSFLGRKTVESSP